MATTKTVRNRSARVTLLALPLVAALLLAGCGSSGGNSSSPPSPSTSSSPPGTTQSGPEPADPTTAKADITKAWETFFSPSTPIDQRAKYVEDGAQLTDAVNAFATMPEVSEASAKVKTITFTSATRANVTYDLLLNATPVLPAASGAAVKTDDGWKVSKNTFCALLALTGQPVPGC